MKHFICLLFCLIAIMLSFGIETISRIEEIEKQTETKIYYLQRVIESQQKEIRILKTDMEIKLNGYERSAEDEKEF